jgi:hypothetical protein
MTRQALPCRFLKAAAIDSASRRATKSSRKSCPSLIRDQLAFTAASKMEKIPRHAMTIQPLA